MSLVARNILLCFFLVWKERGDLSFLFAGEKGGKGKGGKGKDKGQWKPASPPNNIRAQGLSRWRNELLGCAISVKYLLYRTQRS